MSPSWRGVVATLAGGSSGMRFIEPPGWEANVVVELDCQAGLFRGRGDGEDEAWEMVAHWLADYMVGQSLELAGWSEVDNVIDETRYTVARDPGGVLWAIGVAARDNHRRPFVEQDIAYDGRTFDRIAFIDPIDARDLPSILAALESATRGDSASPHT